MKIIWKDEEEFSNANGDVLYSWAIYLSDGKRHCVKCGQIIPKGEYAASWTCQYNSSVWCFDCNKYTINNEKWLITLHLERSIKYWTRYNNLKKIEYK